MRALLSVFKTISWRWHIRNPQRLLVAMLALLSGSLLGSIIIDLNARTASSFSSAMSASTETYGTEIRFAAPISAWDLENLWDREELVHFHFLPFQETYFIYNEKRYPLTITFCQIEHCLQKILLPSSWKYFISPNSKILLYGTYFPVSFHEHPIATARLDISAIPSPLIHGLFLARDLNDIEKKALEELFPEAAILSESEKRKDSDSITSAFRQNLFALALISLLVAGYLVFSSLDLSFESRNHLFSALIRLGVSKKTLGWAILIEVTFLGLGVGLAAWGISTILSEKGWQFLGVILPDVFGVIPGNYEGFLESFVIIPISIFVSLLSAFVAYKRRDLPRYSYSEYALSHYFPKKFFPASALIGIAVFTYCLFSFRDPKFGYFAVFLLFYLISQMSYYVILMIGKIFPDSIEWKLAYRTLKGYSLKFIAPISALSVAISLCVAMTILIASFRYTLNQWLVTNIKADSYFSLKDTLEQEKKLEIIRRAEKQFPGQVLTLRLGETKIHIPNQTQDLNEIPLRADIMAQNFLDLMKFNPPDLTEGRLEGILASETAMLRWNLKVGDSIEFPDWKLSAKIGGIYRNYTSRRGIFLINAADPEFSQIIDRLKTVGFAIYLQPDSSENAKALLEQFLLEHSEYGSHQPSSKLRKAALNLFDRTFAITYILQTITFLLASASIAFALISLISSRRREFAIIASFLNQSKAPLLRIVMKESLGVILASLIIAIPSAGYLTWILIEGINRFSFGWTLSWNLPIPTLGFILTGSILSGMLTSYILGRKLPTLNIWRYLKSRE